ncbi:MAG: iron-sulfur cluster repair di-iron protein [Acidimicrobiales bacterium]
MSELTIDRTLADVVTEEPGAARVFEGFGLDYCCGGRRTLADACGRAGVDPNRLLDALSELAPGPEPDWAQMAPEELVDHLETTHHAYLHAELPRLHALVDKVTGVHGGRHAELADVGAAFVALRDELEPHLRKEERVLFPMIRELATATASPSFHCGTLANPISVMLAEHDRAGELLATLRRMTDGYRPPADGCASYRALYAGLAELEADLHLHVHKENNLLFPAVVILEQRWAPPGS